MSKVLKTSLLLVLGFAFTTNSHLWAQSKNKNTTTAASSRSAPVTLNFVNADIEAVARTIATLTNKNVVVDPRVKGTMNLSTEKPVSPAEAFNQFLSALRLQSYTMVESGGLYKIVPEADAKLQGGESTVISPSESNRSVAGNQIVTKIFTLSFENANNLVPILRPLISANNAINVSTTSNALIITDYSENLSRIGRIIAALDVSSATDLEIIPLKYALASDTSVLLGRLLESGAANAAGAGSAGGGESYKTVVIAEPRSNALIVRAANPARLQLVKSLIRQLDQPSPNGNGAAGNIYVVTLKNADATKLAMTLRAALQASSLGGAGGGAGLAANAGGAVTSTTNASPGTAPIAASAMPSTGGQIQADPATNSLIITALEPQYRQLRAVIDKLDARRAQVFVESLIAEVNSNKAASFGVQWQGVLGGGGNVNIGVLGTNFGSGGSNILGMSAAAGAGTLGSTVVPGQGLNIGIAHKTGGIYVLGALANFLETTGDGNVLSTPNLLTLDNEEAKIVVGQNVPFLTGQYTNNSSGSTTNPFQTIERKDVGITLRIKPQISENGTIKMTIYQEVSNVDPASVNSTSGLVTNKRSLESNVIVDNGAVVVLGGLLQDTQSNSQNRVPGLADVPLFGALFRNENKSRVKTNLMVFLRPVIVRDGASTEDLSLERYQQMRNLQLEQEQIQKAKSSRFNYGVPVLPEKMAPRKTSSLELQLPPVPNLTTLDAATSEASVNPSFKEELLSPPAALPPNVIAPPSFSPPPAQPSRVALAKAVPVIKEPAPALPAPAVVAPPTAPVVAVVKAASVAKEPAPAAAPPALPDPVIAAPPSSSPPPAQPSRVALAKAVPVIKEPAPALPAPAVVAPPTAPVVAVVKAASVAKEPAPAAAPPALPDPVIAAPPSFSPPPAQPNRVALAKAVPVTKEPAPALPALAVVAPPTAPVVAVVKAAPVAKEPAAPAAAPPALPDSVIAPPPARPAPVAVAPPVVALSAPAAGPVVTRKAAVSPVLAPLSVAKEAVAPIAAAKAIPVVKESTPAVVALSTPAAPIRPAAANQTKLPFAALPLVTAMAAPSAAPANRSTAATEPVEAPALTFKALPLVTSMAKPAENAGAEASKHVVQPAKKQRSKAGDNAADAAVVSPKASLSSAALAPASAVSSPVPALSAPAATSVGQQRR